MMRLCLTKEDLQGRRLAKAGVTEDANEIGLALVNIRIHGIKF
jgi:hypothetical protein